MADAARKELHDARPLTRRAYSWLLEHVVLPAGDLHWRQHLLQRLRELRAAQWFPRAQLHADRDRALQTLAQVSYAEVPFYRRLFDEAGVRPDEIRTPEDLRRLPIVTKDMLRAGFPEQVSRPTGQRTYHCTTSGSTGKNFVVVRDPETEGYMRAALMLASEWAGWRIGDAHVQAGMNLKRSLDRALKDALLRCYYTSAYDLTDEHMDQVLDVMERRKVRHLWGYPSALYFVGKRALEVGWNRPLRGIVTWGDNVFAHYRSTLEQAFHTSVTDTYGCSDGFQVAAQCPHGTYHTYTSHTIIEYVDDDGQPVPCGTLGNLLLTRLHPGPMPMLRYRVGDVGIEGPEEPCPCGRTFDRLDSIQGRDTEFVVTPDGNRLIVHFFTGLLENFLEIDCFQIVQETREAITLRLVPVAEPDDALAQRIVAALHAHGAQALRIDVEWVKEIPVAPTGKRRFVLSKIARK